MKRTASGKVYRCINAVIVAIRAPGGGEFDRYEHIARATSLRGTGECSTDFHRSEFATFLLRCKGSNASARGRQSDRGGEDAGRETAGPDESRSGRAQPSQPGVSDFT